RLTISVPLPGRPVSSSPPDTRSSGTGVALDVSTALVVQPASIASGTSARPKQVADRIAFLPPCGEAGIAPWASPKDPPSKTDASMNRHPTSGPLSANRPSLFVEHRA